MFSVFKPIAVLLFKFLTIVGIIIFPIFVSFIIHYIYLYKKGYRRKKSTVQRYTNKDSIFKRILVDFPRRLCLDIYNKDNNEFDYYGLWLFVGEQGSGKSIASADFIKRIKSEFPFCRVFANIKLKFADKFLHSYDDIIFNNNGSRGTVVFIDEIQNWFNSSERCSFPVELIQEICQQRKQHKIIVATSQCFNRVSLALRQQVNFLCKPLTIANCLTVVRVYKPNVSEDGSIKKLRRDKTYFFVHDDEIRSSYDTFEKVKLLSLKEFKN